MKFLDYFKSKKVDTASIAKDRLQIIVAHERHNRDQPDYLPALQKEILEVIRKYIPIADEQISVNLDKNQDLSVLELNITLPDEEVA